MDVDKLWDRGYSLVVEDQPDVALPLLGAVVYSCSLPPFPGVAYVTGAPRSGKSTLARQMVDFLEPAGWPGNLAAPGGPDAPKEPVFIDHVSARLNPTARIRTRLSTAIDDHLHTPGRRLLVMAGDPVSHGEVDDYLWRLTIRQPIPLSVLRESSRPEARGSRRQLGHAFQEWVAQMDRDTLHDEYLSTWPDEHSDQAGAADLASTFGLDLLRRFLRDFGSTITLPEYRDATERPAVFELATPPRMVTDLRDRLISATREDRVRFEGDDGNNRSAIPLVGRIERDRILLIPNIALPILFPEGISPAALGAELESCGLLHRAVSNTRTTVVRIQGRSTRAWVIRSSLLEATELAPSTSDELTAPRS
ncbi:hypothetical protein [Microbacterium sp. YJN-G]|uniref:hypothetical protein n=1 Tax=Microbacterium sp. YJN-G TaxID=2763257 RepID=UPI001878B3C7|nr:hypothetical protein [Microbacterium sp. YJN-G]